MSTFVQQTVTCPACGDQAERTVCISLNAVRAPEHATALRQGTFQHVKCRSCAQIFAMDAPMLYLDVDHGLWLSMYPRIWEKHWDRLEGETLASWKRNTQENAPPMVRQWMGNMTIRAVFGLAALREKVLLQEAGIDDRYVELLKLSIMRSSGLHPNLRPRIIAVEADDLLWANQQEVQRVPRRLLQDIIANPLKWVDAWNAISGGPYVDLGRLMLSKSPSPA